MRTLACAVMGIGAYRFYKSGDTALWIMIVSVLIFAAILEEVLDWMTNKALEEESD